MERELNCLRCDNEMQYIKSETIQLGKYGLILGDISNLLAGGLSVDIFICNKCHKVEFFEAVEYELEQTKCPNCGKMHDFDYPKCPFCKYDYYSE